MEETKDRIIYIDMLKGFSMICIVLGHVLNGNYALQCIVSSFHVPIYFIISGLLWKNSKLKCNKIYIKKVVKNLLIPYFFFSLVNGLFYIIQGANEQYIKNLIKHTLCMAGVGAIWFVPTLAITKIIFSLILKIKGKLIQLAIIVSMTLLFLIGSQSTANLAEIVIYRIIIGTVFIAIGYYCYEMFEKIEVPVVIIIVTIALGLFISYNNGPLGLFTLTNCTALAIFLAVIISFGIMLLFRKIPNNKILAIIGENSLIIMATHQIIYGNILNLLRNLPIIPKVFLFVTIFIIIQTLIIYICNKYFPFLVRQKKKYYLRKNNI